MAFDREKRGLFQRKLEKPQVKKHTPLKSEGTTGSFSKRNVARGVFLFFKGIGPRIRKIISDKPTTN